MYVISFICYLEEGNKDQASFISSGGSRAYYFVTRFPLNSFYILLMSHFMSHFMSHSLLFRSFQKEYHFTIIKSNLTVKFLLLK